MGAHDEEDSKRGSRSPPSPERRLWLATLFCVSFLGVEIVGGIISNSVAILSDAVHLFGDVTAFLISIFALRLASARASPLFTFGLR